MQCCGWSSVFVLHVLDEVSGWDQPSGDNGSHLLRPLGSDYKHTVTSYTICTSSYQPSPLAEGGRKRRIELVSCQCSWQADTGNTHTRERSSPLQLGHAVQLIVVAASEALCKGIILDLQLCDLRTKRRKPLTLAKVLHHRTCSGPNKHRVSCMHRQT